MTTITATPILSSVNASAPAARVDTLLLRYPRWIHAELMTHRVFSRNAASSRAIPVRKLLQDVIDDPAMPLHWGRNQPGMQADAQLSDREIREARVIWEQAMNAALIHADKLAGLGAHKQVVNRILEPYAHITVLVTSTDWSNFLALRDHDDAEPHIRLLAQAIKRALYLAKPQKLEPDHWHLPFVTEDDWAEADAFGRHLAYVFPNNSEPRSADEIAMENLLKLSLARCASTSYKTVEGFDMTLERATALHDKLVSSVPMHASPAEHVAQADQFSMDGVLRFGEGWQNPRQHGNLTGFRQYRKMLAKERL